MAYEPTQWRSGDTITSERLNKMEQGIAGSGSGEFYALHTTRTETPTENEHDAPIVTYSSVELREDGLPMWLIVDVVINNVSGIMIYKLGAYITDQHVYVYSCDGIDEALYVNDETGEVSLNAPSSGGTTE